MKRKTFLQTGVNGLVGLGLPAVFLSKEISDTTDTTDTTDPIDIATIKEFVVAGHGDLVKVREMLKEMPNLIYCRYDWGGGDFEEAIEGAGHVGNKEIANYLIDQGARVNLFILTMLGETKLVKPILEAYPQLIHAKGPHGFSLLHHAKIGGKDSEELHDFLSAKGLEEFQFDMS